MDLYVHYPKDSVMILLVHMDLKIVNTCLLKCVHSNMYWYVLVYHLVHFTIDIEKSWHTYTPLLLNMIIGMNM